MTPLDDYLRRLEHAMRDRGIDDPRIVAEAREHLADAVANGRQRGLTIEDAEREALERFGAPELVAAHAATEKDMMMQRLATALGTIWYRKWWVLAPTLATAIVTSVLSYYFLPTRYRSESVIVVVPQRVTTDAGTSVSASAARARVHELSLQVLSRTRLERIIMDFGLYDVAKGAAPLGDQVLRMRDDIAVTLLGEPDVEGGVRVSFVSSDPRTALRVTERIASLFVEENLRHRENKVEMTGQFVDDQIYELRGRIVDYEQKLDALRASSRGRRLSQADLLPYEVLQERYRHLLVLAEESKTGLDLERRQVGEQFKIVDAARLPETPVGPSRHIVNVAGALVGLGLGVALVAARGRSEPR